MRTEPQGEVATSKWAALAHEYERTGCDHEACAKYGWSQSNKRPQDIDFIVVLGMRSGRVPTHRERRKV